MDPFRERAAVLTNEHGEDVGVLFVRIEGWAQQTGGRLWWRRFTPLREQPHGYVVFSDGHLDDFLDPLDQIEENVQNWSAGRFSHRGEQLRVRWLDEAASASIRDDKVGLPPL